MEWYWILLIVVGSILVLFILFTLIVSLGLVHYVCRPKFYPRDMAHKYDVEKGILPKIDLLERKDVIIKMSDGYEIHGDISHIGDGKKFVIFCHGYSWNREGQLKYAQHYAEMGYSVLLYDHRGHGDNKRRAVTMGYLEHRDLHEIIAWLRKEEGEDIEIGVMGESMGAATVVLEMEYDDNLAFVHADCPYSSLYELFGYLIKRMHLPSYLLKTSSLFMKMLHGYWFTDVQPKMNVIKSKTPLLLITGENDTFIPPIESQLIYDNKKEGYREIHTFPNAEHARSYETDTPRYVKIMEDFLENIKEK